jgi:thiol-disulfide isomerase/thioredoxin
MIQLNLRPLALAAALLSGGFVLAGAPAPALAQEAPKATLKVGDPAPDLSVGTWWQNKKLTGFEKNRVYLVDFWASWCGPCRESFPELARFKARYASEGLEVVAVSIDKSADDAAGFLEAEGGQFDFFIGVDKKGKTWKSWGTAAGRDTIPTSFLVDAQGKILWVGHPMDEKLDATILKALGDIPLDALPITPKAPATPKT